MTVEKENTVADKTGEPVPQPDIRVIECIGIAGTSYKLTRDEILSLIDNKARNAGRDLGFVLRQYTAGSLDDFGRLAEAYALCDLLEGNDPAFPAARTAARKAAKTAAHKRNIREMQARIRELRLELADLRTCLADVREENKQLRMECDNLAVINSLEVTPVFIWDKTSQRITIGEKELTKTSG